MEIENQEPITFNKKVVVIISTPFIPQGWRGTIQVEISTPQFIKSYIVTARSLGFPVRSYLGHANSATYLGVMQSRGELQTLSEDAIYVGIRPKRRLSPGEEAVISDEDFEGFQMYAIDLDAMVSRYSKRLDDIREQVKKFRDGYNLIDDMDARSNLCKLLGVTKNPEGVEP